jgi:HPt (histidine-containing phosphotransfer) domain-containing protein
VSDEHVDVSVLGTLRDVMGGEYPALLDVFIKDSEKRVGELNQLISAPGFSAESAAHLKPLGMMAHSFKGSSGNMGAARLTELCRLLEEHARSQASASSTVINQLVQAITDEFSVVRDLFVVELQACAHRR